MELQLRPADVADRAMVRSWLDADTGPSAYVGYYEPTQGAIRFDPADAAWVALLDGVPVAYASLHEEPPRHANIGFIVRPDRRREGIAKTFLPQLLDTIDLESYTKLVGTLPSEDVAAHKVLSRAGFHQVGYDDAGRLVFERR